MTLVSLDDEQLAGMTPAEVRAVELAAVRRFATTPTFDHGQWSHLVETWNDAMTSERERRHAYCKRHGHQWVELPIRDAQVCRRCVSYRVEDGR